MNELGGKDDIHDDATRFPKWTNLLCPSCAVYYGIQSLIKVIKKKQKTSVIESK